MISYLVSGLLAGCIYSNGWNSELDHAMLIHTERKKELNGTLLNQQVGILEGLSGPNEWFTEQSPKIELNSEHGSIKQILQQIINWYKHYGIRYQPILPEQIETLSQLLLKSFKNYLKLL